MTPQENLKTMGTWPVFLTAISTILGAILFLRFGYAVAHVGLVSTLMIVFVGHLVTVPTALAVAEIATNQKVEGGGAYYMISRSFGLNIGGAIGLALYLSQAISVAFYVIAFTVACRDLLHWADVAHGVAIDPMWVNLGVMALLTVLMVGKGANLGVKALYIVVVLLFSALVLFFLGSGPGNPNLSPLATIPDVLTTASGETVNRFSFFEVFTFIFPAFTGIAAGLGLSGDLKDPRSSIPKGTIWATVVGIVIYIAVAIKLWWSAPLEALAADELYMENIALWGPIIPIGLAAAAMSSALGSVMVAPRTLQAIAADEIFPAGMSAWLKQGRGSQNEPVRASLATCAIAFVFVLMGDINAVAEIISMFFMVTYGAICLVSFLEHMAADPSYRPTFRSHWSISLMGAVLCVVLMFGMNPTYATASLIIMVLIHAWVSRLGGGQRGMVRLFRGVIFQIQRFLQLALQMSDDDDLEESTGWRPFVLAISPDTFDRQEGFDMVRWVAYRHGFGTYMHFVKGFLSEETQAEAKQAQAQLVKRARGNRSRVHLDTIISPSYTSAIAQCIQLPGISGMCGRGPSLRTTCHAWMAPTPHSSQVLHFKVAAVWLSGKQPVLDGVFAGPAGQPRPTHGQLWAVGGVGFGPGVVAEQRSEVWQQARHPFVDHARRQRQLQPDDFAGLHLAGPSRLERREHQRVFPSRRRECRRGGGVACKHRGGPLAHRGAKHRARHPPLQFCADHQEQIGRCGSCHSWIPSVRHRNHGRGRL